MCCEVSVMKQWKVNERNSNDWSKIVLTSTSSSSFSVTVIHCWSFSDSCLWWQCLSRGQDLWDKSPQLWVNSSAGGHSCRSADLWRPPDLSLVNSCTVSVSQPRCLQTPARRRRFLQYLSQRESHCPRPPVLEMCTTGEWGTTTSVVTSTRRLSLSSSWSCTTVSASTDQQRLHSCQCCRGGGGVAVARPGYQGRRQSSTCLWVHREDNSES